MAQEFTIKLIGQDGLIDVKTLQEALANALELLADVETEISGSSLIQWQVVKASMRSPLTLTFSPHRNGTATSRLATKVVKSCLDGIQAIENAPKQPRHFSEPAMESTRKLVESTARAHTQVVLSSPRRPQPVQPTRRVLDNLQALDITARRYRDHGSIEGWLEVISVHGGKLTAYVFDAFTNDKVECQVTKDQFEEAKDLLGKRVSATGVIRYKNHRPTIIAVESFRVLRGLAELPQAESITPINITGDVASEEFIRGIRNAQ